MYFYYDTNCNIVIPNQDTNNEFLRTGGRVAEGAQSRGRGWYRYRVKQCLGGDVAAEVRDGFTLGLQQMALGRYQMTFDLDELPLESYHSSSYRLDRL